MTGKPLTKNLNRRSVIAGTVAVGTVGTWAGTLEWLSARAEAEPLLRPPGALEEKRFLASCIKCGQCVQVCPYHSLKLLDFLDGAGMGTPYLDAMKRGCYLCDLFPCVLCCPSGALKSDVQQIEQVEMGIAVVSDHDSCWAKTGRKVTEKEVKRVAFHGGHTELEVGLNQKLEREVGKTCSLCVAVCRVEDTCNAIRIVNGAPQIGRKCVGCGACAEVCPESIIKILPRKSWEDAYGDHGNKELK